MLTFRWSPSCVTAPHILLAHTEETPNLGRNRDWLSGSVDQHRVDFAHLFTVGAVDLHLLDIIDRSVQRLHHYRLVLRHVHARGGRLGKDQAPAAQ